MKKLLIIDLKEEINEYAGDVPEESWDYDSMLSEYGTPDELAMSAATGFFGYLGSDDPNHDEEEEFDEMDKSIGYGCVIEPPDQFWFDVHHNLNNFKDTLVAQGLVHMSDLSFSGGRLIIEVSNEMDMAKHHDRVQPPRS